MVAPNELLTEDGFMARACDWTYHLRRTHTLRHARLVGPSDVVCTRTARNVLRLLELGVPPVVLVTLESDESAPQLAHLVNSSQILKWYAWNVDIEHPQMHPIPIGVNENRRQRKEERRRSQACDGNAAAAVPEEDAAHQLLNWIARGGADCGR